MTPRACPVSGKSRVHSLTGRQGSDGCDDAGAVQIEWRVAGGEWRVTSGVLMVVTMQALSRSRLFVGLDERVRREVMRDAHERTFSSGQVIMLAREPCQAVYLVVQGVLRAYQASLEGREHVLAYLGPGDLFNVVPALDGGSVPANVDALTDVTLLAIPCDRFGAIVRNHQVVAMAVLQHLAADVRRLGEMVEGLALHTVRARLARFLLSRAADRQSPDQWTQEKIATHIGTVRDVVGRTLRDLAREGLIRQERGRLVVRDRQGLEREAMNE